MTTSTSTDWTKCPKCRWEWRTDHHGRIELAIHKGRDHT